MDSIVFSTGFFTNRLKPNYDDWLSKGVEKISAYLVTEWNKGNTLNSLLNSVYPKEATTQIFLFDQGGPSTFCKRYRFSSPIHLFWLPTTNPANLFFLPYNCSL
jgi:hypothetical protein